MRPRERPNGGMVTTSMTKREPGTAATQEETAVAGRPQGLSEAEAAARRARGENNVIPAGPSRSYRRILAQNAVTPINVTLFVICAILTGLGLYGDALMTASLVTANVVVGVFQEARAKRQLDRISLLARPTATVIRQGRERAIDPEGVVVGDVLAIRPGDQILVDGRVLSESGLTVDESLLTGESDLIPRRVGDTVHSGTFCMGGSGTYLAEKVGIHSSAQRLTVAARRFRTAETPLQREIGLVLRVMAVLAIALSVEVISSYRGSAHGMPFSESVRAAAVLASLVPQGLSFMVTATYAMAVVRMAGSGALIQRINSVESTSHVDVLCLDKTGTLTTNKLVLETLLPLGSAPLARTQNLLGDFCASAGAGNRTTEAIAAASPGVARAVQEEVPFSSERKWSAIAFDDGVYFLGAPEILQPALLAGSDLGPQVAEQTARGLRVLVFASAPEMPPLHDAAGEAVLPSGLEPLALAVLRDELRPEAQSTITQFAAAGIGLKIISGDNPETVAALARQAGFGPELRTVSGLALEGIGERALLRVAEETTVFGRITPQQKERLVRALRRRGHYVAMIGDGVNDVLALKQADLAIAMRSGSQVTRSVADIVLLEDSFRTLPKAFLEGQRIRRGMLDIIRLFLVRTLSVALVILAATLLGSAFPTTPRQNGIPATLTVGIPTIALAAWARPGDTPRRLVFSSGYFVMPAAVSIAWVGASVYQFYISSTGDVVEARSALTTVAVLCGLVLIPFAQPPVEAFVGGSQLNGDWRPTILAGALLALFGAALALPPTRHFYELRVLSVWDYILISHVVLGWAFALRFFWRLNLLDRAGKFWRWLVT